MRKSAQQLGGCKWQSPEATFICLVDAAWDLRVDSDLRS